VVEVLQLRIADAGKVLERQRRRIAEQRLQLSDLRTDQAYLKGEIEHREKVITALQETVREGEPELSGLSDGVDAEVHHMPRRVQAEQELVELSDVEHISTESLSMEDDLTVIDMVLPNYEADRQPA
jgi:predicted  nucleic acid-binding Zn-ribbon protein